MRPRWHFVFIASMLGVISVCSGTMLKQDIPEHNRKHARSNPYAAPIPPRTKRMASPLLANESLNQAMNSILQSVLNPEAYRMARQAASGVPNVATNKTVSQQPVASSSAKTNPTPSSKASTKPVSKASPTTAATAKKVDTPVTKAPASSPATKPTSTSSTKPTLPKTPATKPQPSPSTKSTLPSTPTTTKPSPATQPSTKLTSTSTTKTSTAPTTKPTTPSTTTTTPPPSSTGKAKPRDFVEKEDPAKQKLKHRRAFMNLNSFGRTDQKLVAAPPQPQPQPQPQPEPQPQPPPRNTKSSKKPNDSGEVTPDSDDDNWEDNVTAKPKRSKLKQSTSAGAAASEKAPLLNLMGKLSIVAILIEIVLIIAFNGISIFLFIKTRMNEKANAGKGPAGNAAAGAKTPGAGKKKGGTKSGLTKSKSNSKDSLSKKGSGSKSKSFSLKLPGKKHPPANAPPTPTPTASNTGIKFPPGKQLPGRKNSAGARPAPSTAVNAASSASRVGAGADPDVTTSDIWATTEGGTWVSTVSTVTNGRTAAYEYAEIFGVQDSEHFEADTLEGGLSTTVIGFDSDIEAIDESGEFSDGDEEEEFSDYSSE